MERTDPPSPLRELSARVSKLEHDVKHPDKDAWDKLSAMSGIASGILVALIGFYATNLYDRHSKQSEELDRQRGLVAVELQTVERFFPHLVSKDETERDGAIQAISSLANPELAAKIAQVFGGAGARAALTKIASGSPEARSSVQYALTDLYKDFGAATGLVEVTCEIMNGAPQIVHGTASIVTKDGFALTAGHLFDNDCQKASIKIGVAIRSDRRQIASLVKVDSDLDLALIKMPEADYQSVKIASDPIRAGDAVTILGYPAGHDLTVIAGLVSSTSSPGGRFTISPGLSSGLSGAPIFNSHGEVIGVILGGTDSNSTALPIRFAQPLLAMAGAS
jgi:S1-C subfamily serine protease